MSLVLALPLTVLLILTEGAVGGLLVYIALGCVLAGDAAARVFLVLTSISR